MARAASARELSRLQAENASLRWQLEQTEERVDAAERTRDLLRETLDEVILQVRRREAAEGANP